MITVAHMIVGGAVGVAVGQAVPGLTVPTLAAIVSHYLLDSIPHLDVPPSMQDKVTGRIDHMTPRLQLQAFVDVAFGIVVTLSLWQLLYGSQLAAPFIWGAFGGFLPDLVDNVPLWSTRLQQLPIFREEYAFHKLTHRLWWRWFPMYRYPLLGGVTQFLAVSLGLVYLLSQ